VTVVPWYIVGEAGMMVGFTLLIPAIPYTIVRHFIGVIPGGLGAQLQKETACD